MKRCPNCNGSIIRMGRKEKPFFCKSCNEWFSEPEVTPKQTNADRIRSMSDEELANYLFKFARRIWDKPPSDKLKQIFEEKVVWWLKQEVSDG